MKLFKKCLATVIFALFILCTVACEDSKTTQKSEAVLAAENAIVGIGTVSLNSQKALEEAEKLYAFLTDAEKEQVSNRLTLLEARNTYDALVAEEQQRAEQEASAYEQRIRDVGTAFSEDYDVGKAISAYKDLYKSANEEQKKEIDSLIRILENACIPGTHFLSYEALAVAHYETSYGFIFEKDEEAFVYYNEEKGIYRRSYYAKCKYTEDPIFSNNGFSITGEYYGYLSTNNYKDSTRDFVGIVPYWDYLDTHFLPEEFVPDWGVVAFGEHSSQRVYTDDLGNQLYTSSFNSSSGIEDLYFLIKRAS